MQVRKAWRIPDAERWSAQREDAMTSQRAGSLLSPEPCAQQGVCTEQEAWVFTCDCHLTRDSQRPLPPDYTHPTAARTPPGLRPHRELRKEFTRSNPDSGGIAATVGSSCWYAPTAS